MDVALKTCRKLWTIEKGGERGSGLSVLRVRDDDDDDDGITTTYTFWVFLTVIKNSMEIYTLHKCNVSMKIFWKKFPALVNRRNVLLHDKVRSHSARMTQEKNIGLGWSVQPHPPYSPDLAPSDFHLFRSLKKDLKDNNFLKKIKWKRLWKNLWARNHLNLTWEELRYLINDKRWFKIMANILLIEIIVKVFMNEIIYDSNQNIEVHI